MRYDRKSVVLISPETSLLGFAACTQKVITGSQHFVLANGGALHSDYVGARVQSGSGNISSNQAKGFGLAFESISDSAFGIYENRLLHIVGSCGVSDSTFHPVLSIAWESFANTNTFGAVAGILTARGQLLPASDRGSHHATWDCIVAVHTPGVHSSNDFSLKPIIVGVSIANLGGNTAGTVVIADISAHWLDRPIDVYDPRII